MDYIQLNCIIDALNGIASIVTLPWWESVNNINIPLNCKFLSVYQLRKIDELLTNAKIDFYTLEPSSNMKFYISIPKHLFTKK